MECFHTGAPSPVLTEDGGLTKTYLAVYLGFFVHAIKYYAVARCGAPSAFKYPASLAIKRELLNFIMLVLSFLVL